MKPLPHPAVGSHPLVNAFNALRECVLERTPIPSDTASIDQQRGGFRVNVKPPKPAPQTINAGMNFRGEWIDTNYAVGDVVVVRGGISAGCYICVRAVVAGTAPPAFPDKGDFWVNLSPGNTVGAWA